MNTKMRQTNCLHWAEDTFHFDLVKKLIEKEEIDINLSKNNGNTLLHTEVLRKFEKRVKFLLENKIDVNLQNKSGSTALHLALLDPDKEIIKLLIDYNSDPTIKKRDRLSSIHLACRTCDLEIIKYFFDKNKTLSFNFTDDLDNTLLHAAALNKEHNIIQFLIDNKVDINTKNKTGYTPLSLATICDNQVAIECLLRNGAK